MPTADIDDGTRLTDAGTIQNNIITTALAYKLTGNTTYLNRAVAEMVNAASFDDWNPKKHFLDTAAIMTGMAIGYDWLYNDLSDTQKTTIATAIYDKGVAKAYQQHQSPYCNFNWTGNKTNWNFVCNSAAIIGALSVADIDGYKSTATELVSSALQSMQGSILKFGTDGSWYESPEYGRYGMSYYYPATEAMRSALGTDYGYGANSRTRAFCDYIIHITGGRGVFNYGDYGDDALVGFPGLFLNSNAQATKCMLPTVQNSSQMLLQPCGMFFGTQLPAPHLTLKLRRETDCLSLTKRLPSVTVSSTASSPLQVSTAATTATLTVSSMQEALCMMHTV